MDKRNPNRRKNKEDIPSATFKAFYEELWRTAVAKENGGVEPENVEIDFSPVVFSFRKDGQELFDYLLADPIPVNEKISSHFYFYKKYREAFRGHTVVFDSVLLHNCLLYIGCTLTEEEEKIPSTSDKAKILLRKFEAEQKAKESKIEAESERKAEIVEETVSQIKVDKQNTDATQLMQERIALQNISPRYRRMKAEMNEREPRSIKINVNDIRSIAGHFVHAVVLILLVHSWPSIKLVFQHPSELSFWNLSELGLIIFLWALRIQLGFEESNKRSF